MTKRISKQLNSFKYKGEPVKVTIGTLILTALCILFLIVATFTQITLHHPNFSFETGAFYTKIYRYIPQIPMIFFITALLGRSFGMLAIIGYIVLGMFFPIFALGGGITYLFEYGFGYILAFIPAIFFTGTLLKGKPDFLRILVIATVGVLTIHLLGVLYMLFIATLKHAPMDLISSWITSQSGAQIFYDIFFSIISIFLGKQIRKLLWIVMC